MNIVKIPFCMILAVSAFFTMPFISLADDVKENNRSAVPEAKTEQTENEKSASDKNTSETVSASTAKVDQSKIKYKKHKNIPYLILTANYEIPHLLAKTAQDEKNVPFLLIPASTPLPSPETVITFNSKRDTIRYSMNIQALHLSKFIAYLRPRNVIILGNDEYISEIYKIAVPRQINVIEICDKDWKINALKLSNQLRSSEVYKSYNDYVTALVKKGSAEKTAPAVNPEAQKSAENKEKTESSSEQAQ